MDFSVSFVAILGYSWLFFVILGFSGLFCVIQGSRQAHRPCQERFSVNKILFVGLKWILIDLFL